MEKIQIKQLEHNGVMVPAYDYKGFSIGFDGKTIKLTPEQEEMAVAWVRKVPTEYSSDHVFVRNFFSDFGKAMKVKGKVSPDDFDFSAVQKWIDSERTRKEGMSKEEKKALAAERKVKREENKAKYGFAKINGVPMEISNYLVEPASIFMGRGKHPLRGSWKPGIRAEDITLNLSPGTKAPAPPGGGSWGGVTFDPESLWVARWKDKLRGKMKYVWLSDTAYIKQVRDIEKYDKAWELEKKIGEVRSYVSKGMESNDLAERKVATVCYLIDTLKMRVGDEKDEDEADTVGATTLRAEHIRIDDQAKTVTFDFLGKDSVRWCHEIKPPLRVIENLKAFIKEGGETIFNGIRSQRVNEYLGEAVESLTAKVFRTFHASTTTKEALCGSGIKKDDPVYLKKYHAAMANLQSAMVCNHKRKLPKNWEEVLRKRKAGLKLLRERKAKREKIREAELRVKLMQATRDYNLNTSLKNYIDPRVYADWGREVDFDWKQYYSKSLQRRFAWVDGSQG